MFLFLKLFLLRSKVIMSVTFKIIICWSAWVDFGNSLTGELFPFQKLSDCRSHEYYSVNTLTCKPCPKDKYLIPAENNLSCTCNSRSKISKWDSEFPVCVPCPNLQEATESQETCISCLPDKQTNRSVCASSRSKNCSTGEILVERDLQGSLFTSKTCLKCLNGTAPNVRGDKCVPCLFANCTCPTTTHELLDSDVCAAKSDLISIPDEQGLYMVDFDHVHQIIKSHYLKTHLRSALYKCTKLKRSKSCQAVANMCVMLLYKDDQNGGPCRIFREYRYIPTTTANSHIPWLYYGEGDASILLNRKKIETHYSLYPEAENSMLTFMAARYALDGTFLGLFALSGSDLQLCPGVSRFMDRAFRFGSRYRQSCRLTAKELLQKAPTNEFFDLYLLHFVDKNQPMLYAVPLVISNVSINAETWNKDVEVAQWLLNRRFFFVDDVSGIAYSSEKYKLVSDVSPSAVRYLKSAKLWVKARREKEDEGKIYPPFMILEYGELTHEDIETNANVEFTFSVDFQMDNDISHVIDVSIGILSAVVVVWSGIQTWSYCRRSGQVTIDMSTLLELALTCCGYFSNMIFIVAACVAIHTLVFYKGQSVAYVMLPSEQLENTINKYIILAFLLKIVEVVRLICVQMKIDIFLIDWEKPKAASGTNTTEIKLLPVSIWRTYFVANEWNEIQTKRKTSLLLQMLVTVLLLKVYGFENWTQADPDMHISYVPYVPESLLLRFGVILLVYLFVYLSQWLLMVGVYERYVKNGIQEFVDVCSMANVSVFILLQENYGFYIHGRSVHGQSDTDMQTILSHLRREEENLVGRRGLLPGSDQQTFQIFIPKVLRTQYNKVMSQMNAIHNKQTGSTFRIKAVNKEDADKIIEAYCNMNKFLTSFLDHAMKDLDYEVRERLFVEQLLDIEFCDTLNRGVFYVDNGHSFDNVLYYGNEGTFFSFDLMMFLCMDVIFRDILYAAILTLIITRIIAWIRNHGGRRNLARKTLVDDRFLI